MSRRLPPHLPPELEAGREHFEHWRSHRERLTRIPEPLWQEAVTLARAYGVHRTARVLRLNYDALKSRVLVGQRAQRAPAVASVPEFVELKAPPSPGGGRCTVEFDDGQGGRMRVELEHAEASVVGALASAWLAGRSR